MRRLLFIGPLLLLMLFACKGEKADDGGVYQATDTLPMLITQIQKCSRLYTAEVKVHKIVTHDDVIRLRGSLLQRDFNFKVPLGERKIAIPMDATLKAYIDFSQFSEKNVERSGDKITILLPEPKVVMTSSKINQKEIREYVALSRAHFSDAEMANYEQQGRVAIIQSIRSWVSSRLRARTQPVSWFPCSWNWAIRKKTSPLPSASSMVLVI